MTQKKYPSKIESALLMLVVRFFVHSLLLLGTLAVVSKLWHEVL